MRTASLLLVVVGILLSPAPTKAETLPFINLWKAYQLCKSSPPDKFTCTMLEPSIASSGFSSVRRMWAKLYRLALDGHPSPREKANNLTGEWMSVLGVQREPQGIISPRWFPDAGERLETALVNKLEACSSTCDKLLPNDLLARTLDVLESDQSTSQDLPRQIRTLMKQYGREQDT